MGGDLQTPGGAFSAAPAVFPPGTRGGQVSCGGAAVRWDARLLPLRAGCVDRVVSDLPFGVRCGGGGAGGWGLGDRGVCKFSGFEGW